MSMNVDIFPTWSSVCTVGDNPPCTQKIRLSMSAERLQGRGCKAQVQVLFN